MTEAKSLGKDFKKSTRRYSDEFNSFVRSLGEFSIEVASMVSSELKSTGKDIRRKTSIVIHSPKLSPNGDQYIETIEETCKSLTEG